MFEFESINEGTLRLSAFLGIFLAMALIEIILPRRTQTASKSRRWTTNLLIAGTGSVIVRLMALLAIPIAAVAAATFAEANNWGLLNLVAWPGWFEIILAMVLLDLAIYGQHVASHLWAPLWRLHQVHHTDVEFDVTTAIRFHPIEIALSMLWKIVVVLALGASPWAVILFEVVLNGCAMFNHANIALPKWLDALIRPIIVTPDMHRVHHSVLIKEHNTNYGFCLSVWDRLFRTYTDQPSKGHLEMTIGLPEHQNDKPTGFVWSLWLPFGPRPRSIKKN